MVDDGLGAVFASGYRDNEGLLVLRWFSAAIDRLLFETDTRGVGLLFCARCSSDAKHSCTLFVIGH